MKGKKPDSLPNIEENDERKKTNNTETNVEVSAEQIFKHLEPYLEANFQQFKQLMQEMVSNQNKTVNHPNMYITPVRNRVSPNEGSDDDKMSLNEKQEEINDNIVSPATTPPRSSGETKQKSSSIGDNSTYFEDQEVKGVDNLSASDFSAIDQSYIPQRKAFSGRRPVYAKTQEGAHDKRLQDERFRQLQLQINQLRKETETLRKDKSKLQRKVKDLEIQAEIAFIPESRTLDMPDEKLFAQANDVKVDELTRENRQLKMKIKILEQESLEHENELSFAREGLEKGDFKLKLGDEKHLLTIDKVPEKFKKQYEKLQLDKVDTLSRVQMSNTIKNMMLLTLVGDFDHLASASMKVGKYLKVLSRFLDQVHEHFYGQDQPRRPSTYLKLNDYDEELTELLACLQGMAQRLIK